MPSSPTYYAPNTRDRTTDLLSNLGHALYFSSLFILNNPFFFLETEFRFGIFIALLTLGMSLIISSEKVKRKIPFAAILFLILSYFISSLRINSVGSMSSIGSSADQAQSIVTAYTILASLFISSRFNIRKMNLSLLFISAICFLPIFINSKDIFDYYQRNSYSLGVLTYDSYQAASQIIGFFAISLIAFALSERRTFATYAVTSIVALTAFYTITLSPARGEAIALAISAFILFISRGKLGYVALGLAAILATSQSFFETTLGARLSGVATGDFGDRDYLFNLAVSQFFSDIKTILVGAGLNGFQYYNSLPLELYPHNFLLEGAISGGIILLILLIYIYLYPIISLFFKSPRTNDQNFCLSIMIFLLLINMKSGTIVSFWGMGTYTCIFLYAIGNEFKIKYKL